MATEAEASDVPPSKRLKAAPVPKTALDVQKMNLQKLMSDQVSV